MTEDYEGVKHLYQEFYIQKGYLIVAASIDWLEIDLLKINNLPKDEHLKEICEDTVWKIESRATYEEWIEFCHFMGKKGFEDNFYFKIVALD